MSVAEAISEEFDNFAGVSLERAHGEGRKFTIGGSTHLCSHLFDFSGEISLRSGRGSSSEHSSNEVSSSSSIKGVLTGSSTDVDSNSCLL